MAGMRRGIAAIAVCTALLGVMSADVQAAPERHPILFVHGFEGTGAQFESQALRFTSNGYPADWIDEVDYNSSAAAGSSQAVQAQIDAKIAELKRRTGATQVDLVGHSLGTTVDEQYLTDSSRGAERRASVAHYINVDGQTTNPGVPTLALWGGIPIMSSDDAPSKHMDGAKNVTIPHQTHVQVCTSLESFREMYRFLTGEDPAHDIVPETGSIQLSGRAVSFPDNTGLDGATIEIWPLDATGHRATSAPTATVAARGAGEGGGDFGPATVQAGTRYEFNLIRPGSATALHIYREPFVRSDHAVRLLASDAIQAGGGGRPGSTSTISIRYKELWGDKGDGSDQVSVNGTNLCSPAVCPTNHNVNGLSGYDVNRDGQSEAGQPDGTFSNVPFLSGTDVFVAADTAAKGTATWTLRSRGAGPVRTVTVPTWDSTNIGTVIQWDDYEPASEVERTTTGSGVPSGSNGKTCKRKVPVRLRHRLHSIRVSGSGVTKRRIRLPHKRFRVKLKGSARVTVVVRGKTAKGRHVVERHRYRVC